MSGTELILLFFALELYSGLITFKFYEAAGRKSWEAFVPVYRTVVLLKIIERPWWWVILFYLPVVGNVMAVVLIFELLHVNNFRPLKHTIYAILTLGLYLGYLNFTQKLDYVGRDIQDIRRHVSELAASLIFAIVAATAIRAYTFEAFTIPTPSMEKSLMVGDFLFVSKFHYGSRPPVTPLALPLVHNKIPFTGIDSYVDWIRLPYWRFLKFKDVERGDAVVFNYPAEDIRPINMDGKVRPIDKREHYVKRCVGIPGDTLRIIDRKVMIGSSPLEMPERAIPQWSYYVQTNGMDFNSKMLKEKFDINYLTRKQQADKGEQGAVITLTQNEYMITIPSNALEEFKKLPNVVEVLPIEGKADMSEYSADLPENLKRLYQNYEMLRANSDIFPNPKELKQPVYKWSRDNFGPLWLPAAGSTIPLNKDNFLKYRRAITAYEGNELEEVDGSYLLNGEPADSYTFAQGYYWMMGDNRHSSDDSRYWGLVPEDHIVGKPVFIWMSYDKHAEGMNKIRFDRVFTVVHGEGPGRSYFWPFVVVVGLIYFGKRFYNRRKEKAA